jgi:hypothetical protein
MSKRSWLAAGWSLFAPMVVLMSAVPASAGIVLSVEAIGVQTSQQSNIITETFDTALTPPGNMTTIVSPIGTYTSSAPGGLITLPDAYGGAYQTNYLTIGGDPRAADQMTLTLKAPTDYFGFYFSAIDASNNVDFYDGTTLLGSANLSTLSGLLTHSGGAYGNGYYVNPNNGLDWNEAFVYVNANVTAGSQITSIVFSNFNNTGLETDNHSVRAVPEPGSLALLAAGGLGVLVMARHRRKVTTA